MATLIWIRTEDMPDIIPFERVMLPTDLRPLFKGVNAPRYLIAKGNMIEGREAKW